MSRRGVCALRRRREADTELALCPGQLSGSPTNGHPLKSELVLTEQYVPFPGSGTLPYPPQPSYKPIDLFRPSMHSIPRPARKTISGFSTPSTPTLALNETTVNLNSELAHALQPLLEQEVLLETFVQEATAKRKFEDAQMLGGNLKEIRGEIDRIVSNAEREQARGKGRGRM